jgi:hypothetical protein
MKRIIAAIILALLLIGCQTPTKIQFERTDADGQGKVKATVEADPKVWKNLYLDYDGNNHTFTLSAGEAAPVPDPMAKVLEKAIDTAGQAALCVQNPIFCKDPDNQ